jgi:hypothetical protein
MTAFLTFSFREDLPEDREDRAPTVERGEWLQGHDQRAIHNRIRADFDGSVSRFIDWYDANGPFASND